MVLFSVWGKSAERCEWRRGATWRVRTLRPHSFCTANFYNESSYLCGGEREQTIWFGQWTTSNSRPSLLVLCCFVDVIRESKMVSADLGRAIYISILSERFCLFVCSLPLLSFSSCVSISLVWHFRRANSTQCEVSEFRNNTKKIL